MPLYFKNLSEWPDKMFILFDDQRVFDAVEYTIWTNFEQFKVDQLVESEKEEVCEVHGHAHYGAVWMIEGTAFGDIVVVVSCIFIAFYRY